MPEKTFNNDSFDSMRVELPFRGKQTGFHRLVVSFCKIVSLFLYSRVCPANCYKEFLTFLAVMCFLKFMGASGRATNFLVGVRYIAFYSYL